MAKRRPSFRTPGSDDLIADPQALMQDWAGFVCAGASLRTLQGYFQRRRVEDYLRNYGVAARLRVGGLSEVWLFEIEDSATITVLTSPCCARDDPSRRALVLASPAVSSGCG